MNSQINCIKISDRMLDRASNLLFSIESLAKPKDLAHLRSMYLLLSYCFELILKSCVAKLSDAADRDGLNKELESFGHDIEKLSKRVRLSALGIKNISSNNRGCFKGWIIETDTLEIPIEDFINIRYDFIFDDLRDGWKNDLEKFQDYINAFYSMISKVRSSVRGASIW
jgi:hypothetical protein